MANKGRLIIVSGPSGAGKGTVLAEVFKMNPQLKYSVSATTRGPRPGETDGIQYFFISKEEFERKIARGEMLEYTTYCDNYYGTPADYVEDQRMKGHDIVLEIEPCGARQVKARCADALSIFILPPTIEELEKRLIGRGTEVSEVVAARIAQAKEELARADQYDFRVVNDDVVRAAKEIDEILRK
ncbi:MAG: guanylate kinase [Clostridia bacterium]|nr:guanylate kinase [Clostridia bacterium]